MSPIEMGTVLLNSKMNTVFQIELRVIDQGIGLTIARAAIEAHGGTIRLESEVGKGTTFIIRLPVGNMPPP